MEIHGLGILGGRPIPTANRVAALDYLLDGIGTNLTTSEADMVIDYAAYRFEHDDVAGALSTLGMLGIDRTGIYVLAAHLHAGDNS